MERLDTNASQQSQDTLSRHNEIGIEWGAVSGCDARDFSATSIQRFISHVFYQDVSITLVFITRILLRGFYLYVCIKKFLLKWWLSGD